MYKKKKDPSSKLAPNCLIGPNVTIGPNCVIEEGVRLQNVVVLSHCNIKAFSWIKDSIIGWDCNIGKWVFYCFFFFFLFECFFKGKN